MLCSNDEIKVYEGVKTRMLNQDVEPYEEELVDTAIVIDSQKDAFWLCEDTEPTVTAYRDDEHISDIVDIRHDEAPVCVFPECVGAIKKTQ